MKATSRYLLSTLLLFSFFFALYGEGIPVSTKITHVTVFLKGAQVTREGSVNLPAGMQTLVFRSLASDIRPSSVQVSGEGAFTILSVKPRTNYLDNSRQNPEWQALNKQLQSYLQQKDKLSVRMEVLKSEVTMLEKNQQVAGQNGLSITALSNAMSFYEKKMTAIKTEQITLAGKIKELDEKIKKTQMQMDQLMKRQKMASGEIVVAVKAATTGRASFTLRYYTPGAGWRPGYDIRVPDVSKDVEITYKAFIRQTTGEAWDRIPLTLSTGNPALGGNKPELSPWYLDFVRENYYRARGAKTMAVKEMAQPVMAAAPSMADYVTESSHMTTTQYEITLPFTIFPENKEQAVTIRQITLPADYAYYTVPKLDRDVFLTASVTGWKKYDLLSGKMNLFLGGGFVGTSFLDASQPADTLLLTLGRDKRIKMDRQKIEDFTRKKAVGGNIVETHGWKITVMNARKVPVHLIVEDQIPVSKQKSIVVEPLELSGARLNKMTGECKGDLQLGAGDTKTVVLKFSVKYPKIRG